MAELENPHLSGLVEPAAAAVGGMNALARTLGVTENVPRDWKAGRRHCSPADRARLAGCARLDAVQELVRATLEETDGTKRGEQLRLLLGKWLPRTGGAVASVLLALGSLTYSPTQAVARTLDTMCRKVKYRPA